MGGADPLKAIEHYAQVIKVPRIGKSAAQLAEQVCSDGRSLLVNRKVSPRGTRGVSDLEHLDDQR